MKKGLPLTRRHPNLPGRLCLPFVICSLLFVILSCDNSNAPGKFNVIFETNGGSPVETQIIAKGGMVSQPSNPTKADNSFGGWYKESGLVNLWDFNSDAVNAETTIFAKWNPVSPGSFVVTFDSNGGTVIPDQVVSSGGKATRPANVTKTGAFLDGWYKEPGLTDKWVFTSDTVTAAVTLYAKWTGTPPATVTITFNTDGGSPVASVTNHPYDAVLPASYFGTGSNAPVKAGYRLTGWKNGALDVTTSVKFTQDADLTAQWAWQVTVKFDLGEFKIYDEDDTLTETIPNTGIPPLEVKIDNNTALGGQLPPAPEFEDYIFAGWFNNNSQYNNTAKIFIAPPLSEFTLTARWADEHTVYTQNPAIHPGNHFVEVYPDATTTVKVNETFNIVGLFSNVERNAGILSAKWYRATTPTGEGTVVGTQEGDSHELTLRYMGGTETAAGEFYYWVEVTNTNASASPEWRTSTAVTQNRLKVIVTGP